MDAMTQATIERLITDKRPLTADAKDVLRGHQRRHQSAFPQGWPRNIAAGPTLPNLRAAALARHGAVSRYEVSFSGGFTEPLQCSSGHFPVIVGPPTYKWGSHEDPEVGPLIDPAPTGWNGPALHAYSILTRSETSQISIAAAAAGPNDPAVTINGIHDFRGYMTAHSIDRSTNVFGWQLWPSITQCFYVPSLPSLGPVDLELRLRLSNSHALTDLLSMWVMAGPDTDTNVRITGVFAVNIYQGLGALFGQTPAPDFAPRWTKLLEYRVTNEGVFEPYNGLADGHLDLTTQFKYDGNSTILIFEAYLVVDVTVTPLNGTPCFCAIDARIVDDDRTLVVPDGIVASSAESSTGLEQQISCAFTVSDARICRRLTPAEIAVHI